jgi:UDP-N-acetyl-alpha-D-muramoyl-L-alanyl-L-glutamate epimerase
MSKFVFNGYGYQGGVATFVYSFEGGQQFQEEVYFEKVGEYDEALLERALFLAFVLIGTSYHKTFPTPDVAFLVGGIDQWQATFFNKVYQEGMSQFAGYENKLTRKDLAYFVPTTAQPVYGVRYHGQGILALQSGGKDSLLTAELIHRDLHTFTPWYISSADTHPRVLDELGEELVTAKRLIDHEALRVAHGNGAKNGHVPVTYIVQSLALIQAILLGKNTILTSIGHEGEEPHGWVGDLPITHQWSKTWEAEQLFAEYVQRYVSPDIVIGSPLRSHSELRIAELFVEYAADKYWNKFSSCNIANYMQGEDNRDLKWCGHCPKCANSYLLFAPFVEPERLKAHFGGKDLFTEPLLEETFKGLLGIEGYDKPFECIGETTELALAYHMAQDRGGYGKLSFPVPSSDYDYKQHYPSQDIAL